MYNLRFSHFLSADIQRGDLSWLLAALKDLSVLQPRSLIDGVMVVNLYTDATPQSIAPILPAQGLAHAQVFMRSEEINRAEAIAAIAGKTSTLYLSCGSTVPQPSPPSVPGQVG